MSDPTPSDLAAAPPSTPLAGRGPSLSLLDRLLRDGDGLTAELLAAPDVSDQLAPLAALAVVGAAVFGLAVGLQGGLLQAATSAVKLPVVALGATAVSLPVLHLSVALVGRPVDGARLSAVVLQALAAATLTMAGLVPLAVIVWLSLTSGAHPDSPVQWMAYRRFVLAVVAVGAVGGLVGARRIARAVGAAALVPWSVALGLAGLQLSWLLRPVIGAPGSPVLLRPLESDALTEVLAAILAVLGPA